jgi:hypothetical protein
MMPASTKNPNGKMAATPIEMANFICLSARSLPMFVSGLAKSPLNTLRSRGLVCLKGNAPW